MNDEFQRPSAEWLRRLGDHSPEVGSLARDQAQGTKHRYQELHTQDALDQWAMESTRLAYRHRGKTSFVELLALPVFAARADLVALSDPPSALRNVSQWEAVEEGFREWAPRGVRVHALRRVLSIEQFEHWGPDSSRFLLEQALPGGSPAGQTLALPQEMRSDEQVTHLGFFLMAACCDRGWPRRQIGARAQDGRLRKLLEFVLEPPVVSPVSVGVVQPVSEGIAQGLSTWLGSETNFLKFSSWDLELDQLDPDRWWVRLERSDGGSAPRRLPLRAHLLGAAGITRTVAALSARAECQGGTRH
jgi:hypothetical protein